MRWTNEILDAKRLIGDPPADAVLEKLVAEEGLEGAKAFFDMLIRQIEMPLSELPPSAVDFLQQNRSLPDWADRRQIAVAQELFLDHGPKFLVFLYYKSLPLLYACQNGAPVLTQTGRLAHQGSDFSIFTRRIAETGQFLIDVMTPGSLEPGGKGIAAIQKVRLIHAAIRKFIRLKPWDTETLGVPINQEDMAITLLTFGVAPLTALETYGILEVEARQEAYVHTWNAIGQLMGVQEDLLPQNLEEGKQLLQFILDRQAGPSESGRLLTKALLHFAKETFPTRLLDDAPELMIRELAGEKIAADLGISSQPGCLGNLVPAFLKKLFKLEEKTEERSLLVKTVLDALSREVALGMVGFFDKYKNRQIEIPPYMRQHWKLKN